MTKPILIDVQIALDAQPMEDGRTYLTSRMLRGFCSIIESEDDLPDLAVQVGNFTRLVLNGPGPVQPWVLEPMIPTPEGSSK